MTQNPEVSGVDPEVQREMDAAGLTVENASSYEMLESPAELNPTLQGLQKEHAGYFLPQKAEGSGGMVQKTEFVRGSNGNTFAVDATQAAFAADQVEAAAAQAELNLDAEDMQTMAADLLQNSGGAQANPMPEGTPEHAQLDDAQQEFMDTDLGLMMEEEQVVEGTQSDLQGGGFFA